MSDLEKNEMSIEEEMAQAKSYYEKLSDPKYLMGVNVELETHSLVFKKYVFNSNLNKKEVQILATLMLHYLDWATQTISFKYDDITDLATKSNLSKNMKKLVEDGFLDKLQSDKSKKQRYFFRTQYELMKDVI